MSFFLSFQNYIFRLYLDTPLMVRGAILFTSFRVVWNKSDQIFLNLEIQSSSKDGEKTMKALMMSCKYQKMPKEVSSGMKF